jgi:hypothetical protein
MALTNAERQARFRAKRDNELARLRKIAAKVEKSKAKKAKAKKSK